LVLLKEQGKMFESSEFSSWLNSELQKAPKIIFVIGGASGHGEALLKLPHFALSLSPMTFPHKLARLLFVEQLYRAQTIRDKHPYHK